MLAPTYHQWISQTGVLNVLAMALATIVVVAGFSIVYATAERHNSHVPIVSSLAAP